MNSERQRSRREDRSTNREYEGHFDEEEKHQQKPKTRGRSNSYEILEEKNRDESNTSLPAFGYRPSDHLGSVSHSLFNTNSLHSQNPTQTPRRNQPTFNNKEEYLKTCTRELYDPLMREEDNKRHPQPNSIFTSQCSESLFDPTVLLTQPQNTIVNSKTDLLFFHVSALISAINSVDRDWYSECDQTKVPVIVADLNDQFYINPEKRIRFTSIRSLSANAFTIASALKSLLVYDVPSESLSMVRKAMDSFLKIITHTESLKGLIISSDVTLVGQKEYNNMRFNFIKELIEKVQRITSKLYWNHLNRTSGNPTPNTQNLGLVSNNTNERRNPLNNIISLQPRPMDERMNMSRDNNQQVNYLPNLTPQGNQLELRSFEATANIFARTLPGSGTKSNTIDILLNIKI